MNDFDKEIQQSIHFLKQGKLILCPSDTIWGISCDATNPLAVEKIFITKKRDLSKSLIVLVSDIEMLKNYVVEIPENLEKILETTEKPLTIIYSKAKNLARNINNSDSSIAIRIVKKGFCLELIKSFGKPIVSTSANYSNEKTPFFFEEISLDLIQKIDYIINNKFSPNLNTSSRILKIVNNKIIVLRN